MNEQKLDEFLGQMLQDLGGAFSVPLVRIGDTLGLYKTLHKDGPLTSGELAQATVAYDPKSGRFSLPPEQAAVLADEDSPVYMVAAFDCAASNVSNQPALEAAFKTGEGVAWGNQPGCLFCAVAKFFRPGYRHSLVQEWLPALDGVVEKLTKGARVADVGCGHGHSTVIMAEAFPNSSFMGYDFHDGSISEARDHAETHGLTNATFEVGLAKEYPGEFDLVCFFDCLHDMGDPQGAMAHVRESLAPDGTCMIIEPMANDALEDNLNSVGRLYYSASTMVCVPTSLAQETGTALGAQAGEARLREVAEAGGFGSFRRATETPFNIILEARP